MQLRALFATSKNNLPASLQSAPCSAHILPPVRETNTYCNGAPLPLYSTNIGVSALSQKVVALTWYILERVFPSYVERKNSPSRYSNTQAQQATTSQNVSVSQL